MKTVRIVLAISIAIVMLVTLTGCSKTQKVDPTEVKKYSDPVAERILNSIKDGNYSKFTEDFDKKMKEVYTEEKFKELVLLLKSKIGDYVSMEFAKTDKAQGYTRAFYKSKYTNESGDVTVMVVFSSENDKMLVSGLFFNSPKLSSK